MPNALGHRDVRMLTRADIRRMCDEVGLEIPTGVRLSHAQYCQRGKLLKQSCLQASVSSFFILYFLACKLDVPGNTIPINFKVKNFGNKP